VTGWRGHHPNVFKFSPQRRINPQKSADLREKNTVPHTIVTNTCEGVADCVDACPVACIHEGPGKNTKGTDWYWIDFATCIDCGICLQVCPVEGAIVPEERPELQSTPQ
jgi:NAD-dependent dihydropyrimidine dehydrogenase PreA subunit